MSLNHSEETHRNLLARVPSATGRELREWFTALEDGPSFLRFDDRVRWLRNEHGLAHGHATAIVHEHALRRAARSFE
ncbi:DUF4287 domain-containing protein [Phytoactinopolyspora endophytica]|uniref:DUF4287 domain-containing protein n=1 Tax=Phytoactinopolyspora endophytica TaxID=1642495 RepID=UPI00101D4CF9|nr:DUF4287 domain-containing protein [Phytoactinopolyspora endophytica]